jgi:membrane protein implicated in regulation of membrane protease activity
MSLGTPIFWVIAGISLCIMEFVLPTAFVELTMGLSAIIVAFFAASIPNFSVQVALWLILSILLTLLLRRLVPPKKHRQIEDAKEAQTLTAILPGQTGRVLYEGNSWQARCDDEDLTIAPDQRVYVVARRGTTLIVLPTQWLHD